MLYMWKQTRQYYKQAESRDVLTAKVLRDSFAPRTEPLRIDKETMEAVLLAAFNYDSTYDAYVYRASTRREKIRFLILTAAVIIVAALLLTL